MTLCCTQLKRCKLLKMLEKEISAAALEFFATPEGEAERSGDL
jgi:hypothetical protein